MNKIINAIKGFLRSRSMKYGSYSMILIAAAVGIAVIINLFFTVDGLGLNNLKLDLTPNKMYSIGDQTKDILNGLKKDVEIYGLFDEEKEKESEHKPVIEMLTKYAAYKHIQVVYKDPDKSPSLMQELDPNNIKGIQKGEYVVKCGDKIRKISLNDLYTTQSDENGNVQITGYNFEQEFTGAIKFVAADKTPVAYFVSGHEEQDVDASFKEAKSYIEKNNFEAKALNLMTVKKVPEDASIVVFLSPQKDLTVNDREKLKDYFRNGGNAIFMFDPQSLGKSFPQFDSVLQDFNIAMDNDVVRENDGQRQYPGNPYIFAPELQVNEVTAKVNSNTLVLMNKARSINILKNQKDYITVTELAKTSDSSVGEQIVKSNGADIKGPLDVAVAVENKASLKPSKIVVFGNSAFIDDNMYSQFTGGVELLLSSLNWIQDSKSDIQISPKQNVDSSMYLTGTQTSIVKWTTLLVFPLLILGIGTIVWSRRRHL